MYQSLLNSNHYFQLNADLDSSGSTYALCIKSKLGHSIPPYFVHVRLHVEYKLDETLRSTLECIMHIKASRHIACVASVSVRVRRSWDESNAQ